jgi:hypothetical protein
MREHDAVREQPFADRIDACVPYGEGDAVLALIAEAREISLNAAICVLYEICVPPYPRQVSPDRQHELLAQWMSMIKHPVADLIAPCARALVDDEQIPPSVAEEILRDVSKHDGQLAALAVVVASTDDAAPSIVALERDLRQRWDPTPTSP